MMRALAMFAAFLAVVILALVFALWSAAATPAPPRAPAPGEGADVVEILVDGASPDLTDFTDPATGCTYLVHRLGGVTPRLDAVGRPMCRGGDAGSAMRGGR